MPHFKNSLCGLMVSIATVILACSVSQAETRIGVIALDSAQTEKLVPLVELSLSKFPSVVLVERNLIDAVLREQQLQAVLAADAPDKRAALGKMLKADLLVFLAGRDNPKPHVVVVVCETRQGVRLCSEEVLLVDKPEAEAEAEAVMKQIEAAARKRRQKLVDIVAVPPLLNNSLTHEADQFQGAYALLVERGLLQRPGLLVVELAEAKALAREMVISSSPGVERRLPLYLMGEYRFEGASESRRAQFAWKLLRGEKLVGERAEKDLAAEKLSERLNQAALDLVEKALGKSENRFDPAVEAEQLARRGRVYLDLGMWREALAMSETSLLLKPDDPAVHRDALREMLEINEARESMKGAHMDGLSVEEAIEVLHWLRGALPHLEAFFESTKISYQNSSFVKMGFAGNFNLHCHFNERLDVTTPELRAACAEFYRDRKETAERIIAFKAKAKVNDSSLLLLVPWTEPPLTPKRNFEYVEVLLGAMSYHLDRPAFAAWLKSNLPQICANRLKILQDLVWLQSNDGDRLEWLMSVNGLDAIDPVYLEFLDKAEVLPNAYMSKAAKKCREKYRAEAKQREEWAKRMKEPKTNDVATKAIITVPGTGNNKGSPGFSTTARAKQAVSVDNPEAVFRPLDIAGVSFPWAFFSAGTRCDVVCKNDGHLALMKEKGHLRSLPLKIGRSEISWRGVHKFDPDRNVFNLCWDGKYVWALNPGEDGPLAVVEPQQEKIWRLDAAGGLPPSTSCAVAPLAPGKVCVVGYFGRLWVALATLDPASGIKLEVIHEARTIREFAHKFGEEPVETQGANMAYPISFIATLNSAKAGGKPTQRVVVGREQVGPLLVDPEKRSVTFAPFYVQPTSMFLCHEDAMYWQLGSCPGRGEMLSRLGFPDFKKEVVNAHFFTGSCVFYADRFHVVETSPADSAMTYYTATSLNGSSHRMRCDVPKGSYFAKSKFFITDHYGLLLSTTTGLYQVELKTP